MPTMLIKLKQLIFVKHGEVTFLLCVLGLIIFLIKMSPTKWVETMTDGARIAEEYAETNPLAVENTTPTSQQMPTSYTQGSDAKESTPRVEPPPELSDFPLTNSNKLAGFTSTCTYSKIKYEKVNGH